MTHYALTDVTSNRKVSNGDKSDPVSTSTQSAETCPDSCPLKGAGCYGEGGPQNHHWRKVTTRERGTGLHGFISALRALPDGRKFRLSVTGDLPGVGDRINRRDAIRIAREMSRLRAWTYTHKPPTVDGNAETLRELNSYFAVNLSANNPGHADELAELGIAPVVTVLPSDAVQDTVTPAGRRIKVCPATLPGSDVTCNTCMLCAVKDPRRVIVGFPAHGFRARKIDNMLGGVE